MHKMEKLQLRLLVEQLEQLHSIGQQVQRTTDNTVPYTSTISNLDGDQYYYVTVTNSSVCTKIGSAYVNEPTSVIPFFSDTTFVACFGSSSGVF